MFIFLSNLGSSDQTLSCSSWSMMKGIILKQIAKKAANRFCLTPIMYEIQSGWLKTIKAGTGAFSKDIWEPFMWVVAIYFSIKHDYLP